MALYIHIPFCVSKCKYCDFFSIGFGNNFIPDSYIESLCNEIRFRLKKYDVHKLNSIYIGGGTPSLLSEQQLSLIFDSIKDCCCIEENAEITIEVNPDDVSPELLESFRKNKINRISCGIQSMNDSCLSVSGRRANLKVNIKALEILSNWEGQLSLDLICGLPEETEESFNAGLCEIIKAKPDHISMYSLTIEEETPFGKLYEAGHLNVDFDFSDELWLAGKKLLEQNGFLQYEVSNFAVEGAHCRHNMTYWTHQSYIGCGSGGTGTIYDESGCGFRFTNIKNIEEYTAFWENENYEEESIPQITEEILIADSIFEYFMMGLRKLEGVSENDFHSVFHKEIPSKIMEVFKDWNRRGLCEILEIDDDRIFTLGKKGILYLNKFLEEII